MNYKPIVLLVTILFVLLLLSGTATAMQPKEIWNIDDLKNIGNESYKEGWIMSAPYILMADISIDEGRWVSIGNDSKPFTGTFDGNGKTITFTKDTKFEKTNSADPDYDGYGLFGNIGGTSEIKNVNIVAEGNLTNDENNYFGALVGSSYDIYESQNITDCSVKIKDGCSIEGNDYVGGLVGFFGAGNLSKCHSTGTVIGNFCVGGLAGWVGYDEPDCGDPDCIDPECPGPHYVGIGYISESYAAVSVTGNDCTGGFLGYIGYGYISESYAAGSVIGNDWTGGFLGCFMNGEIFESYAAGSVTGNDYVGGFVGDFVGILSDSYATGDVTGNDFVGGLVGVTCYSTTKIKNSYSSGSVSLIKDATGNQIGGILGNFDDSYDPIPPAITDCFYIEVEGDGADNGYGTPVSPAQMKSINTFTVKTGDGGLIEGDGWSISSSYDPEKTWFILEDRDYPKLSQQYEEPAPGSRSGSGTGSVVVVNSTSEIPDLKDDEIHGVSEIPDASPSDSNSIDGGTSGYNSENGPDWKLYLILGGGLIIVIGGVAYFLSVRSKV